MSDPQSGGDDRLEELVRRYGALPVGLVVAAVLLFIIGVRTHVPVFMLLTVACVVAAYVLFVRMGSPAAPGQDLVQSSTTPVSDEVRRQRLEDYLSLDLSRTECRIESVTSYSAVVVYGKPVNHVLHLLATVFLCGLWLPMWIILAVSGGETRSVLSVDRCGNVTES